MNLKGLTEEGAMNGLDGDRMAWGLVMAAAVVLAAGVGGARGQVHEHGADRAPAGPPAGPPPRLELHHGDRIVLVGNTMAERLGMFGHFEALMTAHHADKELTFRNLGWSGDTLALRMRPLNFGDMRQHLHEQEADVIFAFYGMNESFEGEAGLERFREDLREYLAGHRGMHYNARTPPRIVLVSPNAQEPKDHIRVDIEARHGEQEKYTRVMAEVAREQGVLFLDVFEPTRWLVEEVEDISLTFNGIHLTEEGDRTIARLMMKMLGFAQRNRVLSDDREDFAELLDAVREKNELFFYRWRAVNGEYIYGRRREPFGVVNFPPEMARLDEMVAERERAIYDLARAVEVRFEQFIGGDPRSN